MNSSRRWRGAKAAALVLLALVLAVGNGAVMAKKGGKGKGNGNAAVTLVTAKKMGGWQFYDDQNDRPIDPTFGKGPDKAPLGNGSAALQIGGNNEGKMLSAHIFLGTPLSDFQTLTYGTFVTASQGSAPSLQLGIDYDPHDNNINWQGRLVYVPSAGGNTVQPGTWQTWDALDSNQGDESGNWFFTQRPGRDTCSQADLCTWDEVTAAAPTARIHYIPQDENNGAGLGFIGFKVGSGEGAVDANVDKLVVVTRANGKATFNFDK